jgi:hypothetical protein
LPDTAASGHELDTFTHLQAISCVISLTSLHDTAHLSPFRNDADIGRHAQAIKDTLQVLLP